MYAGTDGLCPARQRAASIFPNCAGGNRARAGIGPRRPEDIEGQNKHKNVDKLLRFPTVKTLKCTIMPIQCYNSSIKIRIICIYGAKLL